MAKRRPRIALVRAYDITPDDKGYRVLVDGLWPRGVKKESLGLDEWAKSIAPTATLRKWFNHDPQRWDGFQERYGEELKANRDVDALRALMRTKYLLLIYAARDLEHNNAVVLRNFLMKTRSRR